MPDYTTKLNLAKPNTTTEPNNTFNLDTYLNDNWEKIDTFAGNTITTDKLINNLASTEAGFGLDSRQGTAIGGRLTTAEGTIIDHATQLSEKANYGHFGITNNQSTVNGGSISNQIILDKTVIDCDFAQIDGSGNIKILKDGTYEIMAQVQFATNAVGDRYITVFNSNKSATDYTSIMFKPGDLSYGIDAYSPIAIIKTKASINDLIKLYARQTSGASLNVDNSSNGTKLIITKVG